MTEPTPDRSRALIDALQDGVAVIGPDLRMVEVNRSLCEMTGFPEHELLGAAPPYPLWHQEDAERLSATLGEAFLAGAGRFHIPLRRADGERFPAVADVGPIDLGPAGTGILCVVRDVTEQSHAEAEMVRMRDFLQGTLDSLSGEIAVIDRLGAVVAANLVWKSAGGAPVGDSFLVGWEDEGIVAELRSVLDGERESFKFEYRRESHRYAVCVTRYRGHGPTRVVVQRFDVTAQCAAQDAVRMQARLLDEVDAAVIATDPDGVVTFWSRGAERFYGHTPEQALGRFVFELDIAAPDDPATAELEAAHRANLPWEGEFLARRHDGSFVAADLRLTPTEGDGGAVTGVIGISVDVSERVRTRAELRAARDHLRAVTDSMGEGLYTVDEDGGVTFMNPAAEQMLGWSADELIGRSMHALIHHRHENGVVFDESACPILAVRTTGGVVRVSDDVFVRRDGTMLPVSYTSAPLAGDGAISGAVIVFSDATKRRAERAELEREVEALTWMGRIRDALDQDRFELFAQPIIDLPTGKTVQHELLIRMRDEDGGLVPPGMFLPVAEQYGLIRDIDRWVIREAAGLAAQGHAIELNLSAESLGDPSLLAFVEGEFAAAGTDAANVVFELTETGLLRDEEAARLFIEGVDRLGSKIALDDFGTGYGGFTYVKRLPVDYLKIDIEFVRDLPHNQASAHVVRAVVNLARDFGQRTVAEGVENAETQELLREMGVDFAQGYGIGRPAPLEDGLLSRTTRPAHS